MQQRKTIAKDEGVMLGKPTVAGTRLTIELIVEKIYGWSTDGRNEA